MISTQVDINHYDFEETLFDNFKTNHFAKDLWPLVYILSDGETKTAYVGETTDVYSRMSTHLKHKTKSKLTSVHLISSEKFNKSATLDIESNLIKYMSGDNVYQLLNGNLGLANHNYYQKKEVYRDIFNSVWNQLRAEGITKHSIEHIDNSDLFKYSPYKSLWFDQRKVGGKGAHFRLPSQAFLQPGAHLHSTPWPLPRFPLFLHIYSNEWKIQSYDASVHE